MRERESVLRAPGGLLAPFDPAPFVDVVFDNPPVQVGDSSDTSVRTPLETGQIDRKVGRVADVLVPLTCNDSTPASEAANARVWPSDRYRDPSYSKTGSGS